MDMEPFEVLTTLATDILFYFFRPLQTIIESLMLSILVVIILILLLPWIIKLYFRFSVEMCDCKVDMTGKTVIITGANTGIGRATAISLASMNAKVILACKNEGKGIEASKDIINATGNADVISKHLDLSNFKSVRDFANDICQTEERLHLLINNAAIPPQASPYTTEECDLIMQTNYFGHFLLTTLLLDLLKKSSPSRIINVTCFLYRLESLNPANTITENPYSAYCNSKMAMVLFTRGLALNLEGTGVSANAVNPGFVQSRIIEEGSGIYHFLLHLKYFLAAKSPVEGSQTVVHVAVAPELQIKSGKYFSDCREARLSSRAKNDDLVEKMWRTSVTTVNLPYEMKKKF